MRHVPGWHQGSGTGARLMPKTGLLPLPYPPATLAPTIDPETVLIHHDKHQASYVKGWNELVGKPTKDLAQWQRLAFNGAGVILHEMYWENLCAAGHGGAPSAELQQCLNRCFGSTERMAQQMVNVGAKIEGSGWVVLAWIPRFDQQVILPIEIHQNGWIPTAVPLLVIDVWEHAYYLQYQSRRADYLRLIWHNVNWNVVSQRYGRS